MGLLDSVFGAVVGITQLGKAGKIHPEYSPYQVSQYAKDNLSNAQNAYNGRMAGATSLEQNILGNEANANAMVDRTATDGSQALAAKIANQGQSNQAFHNLQTQEAQQKYQMLNSLNMANQGLTTEGDKVYQDKLQKYQMDAQAQAALRSAGLTNISGAIGGLTGGLLGGGGGKGGGLLSMIL